MKFSLNGWQIYLKKSHKILTLGKLQSFDDFVLWKYKNTLGEYFYGAILLYLYFAITWLHVFQYDYVIIAWPGEIVTKSIRMKIPALTGPWDILYLHFSV